VRKSGILCRGQGQEIGLPFFLPTPAVKRIGCAFVMIRYQIGDGRP
jgi:hypothetical protein